MGYAGYYDLANASGIALANGVARWLCLAQGGPETQAQLDESAAPVLDNLARSSYLTDLDGGTAGFGSLSVKDLSFPWLRIFELHIFLEAH